MDVKKNLMLWLTVFALALPLLITGTASAKYMGDGAVQDGTTGGWITPNDMVCIKGVHQDGTLDIVPGVTNSRDCIYYNTGLTGMDPIDVTVSYPTNTVGVNSCCTTGAGCGNLSNLDGHLTWIAATSKCYDNTPCVVAGGSGNDGARHAVASSICVDGSGNGISLKDVDRTLSMCVAKGGTWKQTSATAPYPGAAGTFPTPNYGGSCVAYGRQFTGQDATATPKPFGSKGTDSSVVTDMGYCYTSMNWTAVYATAACPSLKSTTAPFDTNAAYDWSVASSQCRYAKSIAGKVVNNLVKADGTITAAGAYVDLSTITTMGDCLATGASWNNWVGIAATTSVVGSDSNTYKKPNWDYKTQVPDADEGCLHCHSTLTQYNGPSERSKESYLKTGHKNMLRKVTAGKNWAGPDGVVYSAYAAGTLNFSAATAQVSGVDKPLLYIFGDWMAAAPAGLDVVVDMGGATGAKYNGTSNYSCAACHSTGWNNNDGVAGICSLSSKTTAAACTTAGGTWYPMIGVEAIGDSTYVPQQPAASFPGITFTGAGKWDIDGITCGRCHNAAVGPVTSQAIAASQFPKTVPTGGGMGNLGPQGPVGGWATNLCFGCHQSMAKTLNGTGLDADLNNPTALIVKNTAVAPAYVPGFSGHVLGNSFLNSPHSRFTGSVTPNALGKYDIYGGTYNSNFKGYMCWQSSSSSSPAKTKADGTEIKDKATCESLYGTGAWRPDTQGNCTTCHDVHNSLFVEGQEGLRKECESCHENSVYAAAVPSGTQVDVATTINHPKIAGTPFDTLRYKNACEVCHMPKPTPADFPMHVWRINSDPAYSTFPTGTEFGAFTGTTATKKNANTSPDGTYTNAVWVDVDLACGQCHGGSYGAGATKNGALYIDKTSLGGWAKDMHKIAFGSAVFATPNFVWSTDAVTSYNVSFNAGSTICPAGETCTYAWDFGDTTTGTGVTTSKLYTSSTPTPVNVKLTVKTTTDTTGRTITKAVYPVFVNHAPVAAGLMTGTTSLNPAIVTNATNAVSFTDASSDADGNILSVSVNWGDGTIDTQVAAGGVFTHSYTRASKFAIIHTVRDTAGKSNVEKAYVKIVPPKYVISGAVSVGGTNVSGVFVSLKFNGRTKAGVTTTSGLTNYTFPSQLPGSYTMTLYKRGCTFSNPGTINLTADTTVNITGTCP